MVSMSHAGTTPGGQIALTTVMMLIALVSVGSRLYARKLRKAKLLWDDWTVIAALLFTLGQAIGLWYGVAHGRVGNHSIFDPETGLPYLNKTLQTFLQVSFASLLTSTLAIGLTKISVVLLYRRIFQGTASNLWFQISTWFLIAFAIAWTIAFFFSSLFECKSPSDNWVRYGSPDGRCVNETQMYIVQAWTDTITDFLILLIPVPCVWSLRMPLKQKLAVTCMFLLGAITLAISITKLIYFYQITTLINDNGPDLMYYLTPTIYWPMIESSLGITGACLPLLKPIFDEVGPFVQLSSYLSSLASSRSRTNTKATATGGSSQREIDSEKGPNASSTETYVE